MFFYAKDRFEYGLHVHTETKNLSFHKMSKLLRDKGISNNKFMLYLLDKDLINIDPHNLTDPSIELALRIVTECKQNPWYYIREMVRVPVQGMEPQPYILHRGNMALTWCFYQSIDTFLMLPRQFFKTVSTMAIISHLMFFATRNFPMALLTKDNKLVKDNVGRLRDIKHALPAWSISKSVSDKENIEEISYTALNNKYTTICAQNDELSADRVARGASTPVQQYDEFDFIKYIRTMYGAAVAATSTARVSAAKAGAPHANILTSTAGYLDTEEGEFAQSIRADAMMFYDQLYDCISEVELKELLETNSANKMMLIIYSFLQLGKTHEWLKEIIAREKRSDADVQRDYYLIPTSGQGDDGIPSQLLKNLRDHQIEPLHTDTTVDRYVQHWYIPRDLRSTHMFGEKKFILGLDSSEGIGQDWISTVLVDTEDLSVVSTFRINEVNIAKLSLYIAKFLIANPNVIFIPEAKSSGRQILDVVLAEFQKNNINPYKRIFNDVVQNLGDAKYSNINIYDYSTIADSKARRVFGFTTAGSGSSSRDKLFADTLFRALETNSSRIYDKNLINEFCGLRIRNGRLDHKASGHDDMVVAYLLTCYLAYFGKNLHYYGLDERNLMSRIDAKGNTLAPEIKHEKDRIMQRVTELTNLMKTNTSPILTASYKRELNHLKSMENFIPDLIVEEEPKVIDSFQPKDTLDLNKTKEFYDALIKARTALFR